MALRSLEAISLGGIRDHIGGGFHRYTVDAEWKIPHYEKMLYDQAILVNAYLDAWLLTRDSKYRQPVLDTLEYLQRDMRHDQGGFFSAEDAESYESKEATEKREGAFYVWSSSEIASALKDDALIQLATAYFTLRDEGNAPSSVNSEDLRGYNT
ncbi:MAG: thioredoxin domain-containing protein, partial [Verrucomicrobiia bacterium]